MRHIVIAPKILKKLKEKHGVERREIEQCFANRAGNYLEDDREDHRTDPETLWFIAPTNTGRLLKIAFMFIDGNIHIKSAFEPFDSEIEIYNEFGR